MKIRATLLAVAGVSAVLLTVTKLGVSPVAPGPELEFRTAYEPQGGVLLTADAGDVNCWIRLAVTPSALTGWTARFVNGAELGVAEQRDGQGHLDIFIHRAGASATDKFDWPAGVGIRVLPARPSTNATFAVDDWALFPKDKESDAAWKANRRWLWSWTSGILLLLSLIGIVVREMWPEKGDVQPFSAQTCISGMIAGLEGQNPAETKQLRNTLLKVLVEGASLEEALGATGLSKNRAAQLWFKARRMFLERLSNLVSVLLGVKRDIE